MVSWKKLKALEPFIFCVTDFFIVKVWISFLLNSFLHSILHVFLLFILQYDVFF